MAINIKSSCTAHAIIRHLPYIHRKILFSFSRVYRELPPVSQIRSIFFPFFDEDDETEAQALWFTASPEDQPSGEDIPR